LVDFLSLRSSFLILKSNIIGIFISVNQEKLALIFNFFFLILFVNKIDDVTTNLTLDLFDLSSFFFAQLTVINIVLRSVQLLMFFSMFSAMFMVSSFFNFMNAVRILMRMTNNYITLMHDFSACSLMNQWTFV